LDVDAHAEVGERLLTGVKESLDRYDRERLERVDNAISIS
jgi:hypothetical protein